MDIDLLKGRLMVFFKGSISYSELEKMPFDVLFHWYSIGIKIFNEMKPKKEN